MVEKFWEAGPGSLCMKCCGIFHERTGSCGDRPVQCVMCAGERQVSDHQCGVNGCNKGRGKICMHVVARCANCNGNHQANSFRCQARQKAEGHARKNMTLEGSKTQKSASRDPTPTEMVATETNHDHMDLGEIEEWSKSPREESSSEPDFEGRDYT